MANPSAPPSSFTYASTTNASLSTPKPKALKRSQSTNTNTRTTTMPLSPTGPRPLHLLDLASASTSLTSPLPSPALRSASLAPSSHLGSPIKSPRPLVPGTPTSATSTLPSGEPRTSTPAKRQSATLSYFPPDHVSTRDYQLDVSRGKRPVSAGFGLGLQQETVQRESATRPASVGGGVRKSVEALVPVPLRSATTVTTSATEEDATVRRERERPPLTSSEKHAELLHFIAQKEAKCLELRSQLAVHEEELLQLKKKWERIVNRGLERSTSSHIPSASISSPPYSPFPYTANTQPSVTTQPKDIPAALMSLTSNPSLTLEGIREGVQGMSRLLAAGLNLNSQAKLGVPGHRPSGSSSPIPPSPLSMSSTSLVDSPTSENAPLRSFARHAQRTSDSSATTTTSMFTTRTSSSSARTSLDEAHDAKKRDTVQHATGHASHSSVHSSPQELMMRDTGATPVVSPNPAFLEQKARRRKRAQEKEERERVEREEEGSSVWDDESNTAWDTWGEASDSAASTTVEGWTPAVGSSGGVGGSAPASSIPSLGAVSAGAAQVQSWVGKRMGSISVGMGEDVLKKSGDVISRSQKRASLMLSDMSQSLVSALVSPPPPSSSASSSSPAHHPLSSSPVPSSALPIPSSSSSSSASSASRRENGNGGSGSGGGGSVSPGMLAAADPMFGLVSPVIQAASAASPSPSSLSMGMGGERKRDELRLGATLQRNLSLGSSASKANAGRGKGGAVSLLDDSGEEEEEEEEEEFGELVGATTTAAAAAATAAAAGGGGVKGRVGMGVMKPDNVKPPGKTKKKKEEEEEEDEWNW